MKASKNKIKNVKDKLAGETKELIGEATDNQELELKGKIQSSKSDSKEKASKTRDSIAGKINDIIDKKKDNNDKK